MAPPGRAQVRVAPARAAERPLLRPGKCGSGQALHPRLGAETHHIAVLGVCALEVAGHTQDSFRRSATSSVCLMLWPSSLQAVLPCEAETIAAGCALVPTPRKHRVHRVSLITPLPHFQSPAQRPGRRTGALTEEQRQMPAFLAESCGAPPAGDGARSAGWHPAPRPPSGTKPGQWGRVPSTQTNCGHEPGQWPGAQYPDHLHGAVAGWGRRQHLDHLGGMKSGQQAGTQHSDGAQHRGQRAELLPAFTRPFVGISVCASSNVASDASSEGQIKPGSSYT